LDSFTSLPGGTAPRVGLLPIASNSASTFLSVAAHSVSRNATPTKLESASKITGIIESVLKVVALIVGGLFAYWKFFMGRTFQPRLEPSISATARLEENQTFLSVVCKLKNVGLSRVELDREKSALRVLLQTVSRTKKVTELDWPESSNKTVDVFKKHEWIEGGETIEDAHLFVFPYVPNEACRVELAVIRARRTIKQRWIEWKRRRKGPNAWWQHVIVDRFTSEPTNNATEAGTKQDEKPTTKSDQD